MAHAIQDTVRKSGAPWSSLIGCQVVVVVRRRKKPRDVEFCPLNAVKSKVRLTRLCRSPNSADERKGMGCKFFHMPYEKIARTTEEGEVWGDIPALDLEYSVSTLGRIYSNRYHRYLSPWISRYGYLEISIKGKHYHIHQLIANALLDYTLGTGYEINHIDGNKLNNSLDNLEIVSHSENMRHAWRTGLINPQNISLAMRRRGKLAQIKENRTRYE